MPSKWLDWTPGMDEIIEKSPTHDPSKPSELGFDGFEGAIPGLFSIIRGHEESSKSGADAIEKVSDHEPSKPTEPPTAPTPALAPGGVPDTTTTLTCPALPKGVRLIRYTPKDAPVAIDVCSVVVDVPKFIAGELRALDSRLNDPWTIHGGFTVPQMLDRLRQAGLEVELDPKGGDV